MDENRRSNRSIWSVTSGASSRKVSKVPFVELHSSRLQGVISSSSDIRRVYVAFIESGTGNFYCSTNNNRPCGGLRGSPCKHIKSMVDEALLQYSAERVVRFLKISADPSSVSRSQDILRHLQGQPTKEQASSVFSRFLRYLKYLEYPQSQDPVPEMTWFVNG